MLVNQALVQGRGVAWGERALAQKEALSQGVKIHTVLALPPPRYHSPLHWFISAVLNFSHVQRYRCGNEDRTSSHGYRQKLNIVQKWLNVTRNRSVSLTDHIDVEGHLVMICVGDPLICIV
jgi:hypothetical protein